MSEVVKISGKVLIDKQKGIIITDKDIDSDSIKIVEDSFGQGEKEIKNAIKFLEINTEIRNDHWVVENVNDKLKEVYKAKQELDGLVADFGEVRFGSDSRRSQILFVQRVIDSLLGSLNSFHYVNIK